MADALVDLLAVKSQYTSHQSFTESRLTPIRRWQQNVRSVIRPEGAVYAPNGIFRAVAGLARNPIASPPCAP